MIVKSNHDLWLNPMFVRLKTYCTYVYIMYTYIYIIDKI